jgi:apolipoprotein D and lipocalin family protein
VRDPRSNAVWGMQFVWPIKADYRIVYVSPDYRLTIIGRQKRDNVWIMARTPKITDAELADLRERVAREGYDLAKLRLVPQRWP